MNLKDNLIATQNHNFALFIAMIDEAKIYLKDPFLNVIVGKIHRTREDRYSSSVDCNSCSLILFAPHKNPVCDYLGDNDVK